jgi:hypothetical protein
MSSFKEVVQVATRYGKTVAQKNVNYGLAHKYFWKLENATTRRIFFNNKKCLKNVTDMRRKYVFVSSFGTALYFMNVTRKSFNDSRYPSDFDYLYKNVGCGFSAIFGFVIGPFIFPFFMGVKVLDFFDSVLK